MDSIRVDSLISQGGLCARRKVSSFLEQHYVTADGVRLTEGGQRVATEAIILIDGKPMMAEEKKLYIMLNKPQGYLCASSDDRGRPLAVDLLPQSKTVRLYNVGRLDFESCGLIFFTNDGQWAKQISHPSSAIEKEYYIETYKPFTIKNLISFKKGIIIENEHYQLKDYILPNKIDGGLTSTRLILTEGKNREIRTVFKHFDARISYLRRVRIGNVRLENLAEGASRLLNLSEIEQFWLNKTRN